MTAVLTFFALAGLLIVIAGFAEATRLGYVYFFMGFFVFAIRALLMHDMPLALMFTVLMGFHLRAYIRAGRLQQLRVACRNLLAWVRERHPLDFMPGGRGYTCPYHRAIARAL